MSDTTPLPAAAGSKGLQKELSRDGRVRWSALSMYFKAFGSSPIWTFIITGALLAQFLAVCQTGLLGMWSEQYNLMDSASVPVERYV